MSAQTKPEILSSLSEQGKLVYEIGIKSFLKPVATLLADPSVSEIIILGPKRIYIERGGRLYSTELSFPSVNALEAAVNTIAQFCGKTITAQEPILDGRLPDGSRICIVMPPVSDGEISVNIRRFSNVATSPDFLLQNKSITEMALEYLSLAVASKQNVLVSGGTGSGKTTLLNILSRWFAADQRIVVIEDTRELKIQQEHVVSMEAQAPDPFGRGGVSIRDMFIASLRMRPDRIIVGEVRSSEAIDMIQAMNSGHGGTLATIHADSPLQACGRLEVMALMAELGLPMESLRRQIALALHLIVQVSRLYDGRRCVTSISEVGFDDAVQTYRLTELFALRSKGAELNLEWTGNKSRFQQRMDLYNLRGQIKLTAEMWD